MKFEKEYVLERYDVQKFILGKIKHFDHTKQICQAT
jgi:hypothetical protein